MTQIFRKISRPPHNTLYIATTSSTARGEFKITGMVYKLFLEPKNNIQTPNINTRRVKEKYEIRNSLHNLVKTRPYHHQLTVWFPTLFEYEMKDICKRITELVMNRRCISSAAMLHAPKRGEMEPDLRDFLSISTV